MVLFLTVPASAVIAFLSSPITRVIYERGQFTAADTAATAGALVLYTLGIPFMAALRNVAAVFYAQHDAKTPMYASFAAIGLNIVLNATLMWVIGFMAFPLSTTVAAAVNIGILLFLLPKKTGRMDYGSLGKFFLALSAAAAAGGAAGRLAFAFWAGRLGTGFWPSASGVAVCGALALAVFYAGARLLGLAEVRDYLRRFLRK